MKQASFAVSAFLLIAGSFAGGCDSASAFPSHAFAAVPQSYVVMVLCKYGTPHCVNPNPRPEAPKIGGEQVPPNGWQDPDCKSYGNCNTGGPGSWGDPSVAGKGPLGTQPGRYGTTTHIGLSKHR
jgi:hypothetical protein